MNNILLLGAGFSRNWGGWLGDEVFEYLLGNPKISSDEYIKNVLWKHRKLGGFENALAVIQNDYRQQKTSETRKRLEVFSEAIIQMFADMESTFSKHQIFSPIFQNFLARFSAIFTLNQDLLLEAHYHCGHNVHSSPISQYTQLQLQVTAQNPIHYPHGWVYWDTPGIRHPKVKRGTAPHITQFQEPEWSVCDLQEFKLEAKLQPIIKLHGSYNWKTSDGNELLVTGGNKVDTIGEYAVLKWYFEIFEEYLSKPDTNLMIIGYSFRDDHINKLLCKYAENKQLKTFIVDPLGVEVIAATNKTRQGAIYQECHLESALNPTLIGASRRPLQDTFGLVDKIEYGKIMRFFKHS